MSDVTQYNWVTVDGKEWGIHLWGELEEYEDGTRQVVDIEARYLLPNGSETTGTINVPQEVIDLANALLDDHETGNAMLEHGAIH